MSKGPGGQYVLPPIHQRPSPNQSVRRDGRIIGVVMHATQGHYAGDISWLCNPAADASAHIVVREDGNDATQLVHWRSKAWHAVAANDHFIGIELSGFTNHESVEQWESAARIVGYLCHHFHVPAVWNVRHGGAFAAGITRHRDLGLAGGGHLDPLDKIEGDAPSWLWFIARVQHEVERGGFLEHWGID